MRASHALLLLLCAVTRSAQAEFNDMIQPVPAQAATSSQRHLLADGSYGAYGYGAYGYTGYGGHSETVNAGHRRHLMQSDTGGSYGYGYGKPSGYGYGGSGTYGGSRRHLAEVDVGLQPRDVLLEYAEQKQEQPAAQVAQSQDSPQGLSAAATAALQQAHRSKKAGLSVPLGQCYCRYDVDFNTWALVEDVCKQVLYERCKTEPGLPCGWLDQFYGHVAGPAHHLPHEEDIAAFLHEDCSPQPPCACSGLNFDGSDPVSSQVGCCRDLRVACKTPFSGICCKKVAAFCSDDKPIPMLAAWTAHNLHHADCSNYEAAPYKFVPYKDMLAAAAAAAEQQQQKGDTAEEQLLHQAVAAMETQNSVRSLGIGAAMGAATTFIILVAGSICVVAVAVFVAMIKTLVKPNPQNTEFETDGETNEDADGNNNVKLSMGGCEGNCGSSGVQVPSGAGVKEPLLQSHSSNPMNRPVSSGSGLYNTTSGDYIPRSPSQRSLDNMS